MEVLNGRDVEGGASITWEQELQYYWANVSPGMEFFSMGFYGNLPETIDYSRYSKADIDMFGHYYQSGLGFANQLDLMLALVRYDKIPQQTTLNSTDDIINNPKALHGKTAEEIANLFEKEGYAVRVENSQRGSGLAKIVRIEGHKINMIQVHPGGGMHGLGYIKVKGNGVNFKVVDGLPSDYMGNPGQEKATFYWMGERK